MTNTTKYVCTEKIIESWEETKKGYILQLMASFQKYFGKKAQPEPCPDCGGGSWYVCEKNIREIVNLVLEAGKRDADKRVSSARAEERKRIVEVVSGMKRKSNFHEKHPHFIETKGHNQALDDVIKALAQEKEVT